MARLEGKVAVITGATGGIGSAAARLLAAEGARLALVDLDESALREVARSIGEDKASYTVADVTQPEQAQAYIQAAVDRWGGIDALLANAGIEGTLSPITDYPVDVFDRVMAGNVRGVWLGMKYGIPHLERAGGGSIIVTASIAAITGVAGVAAYCASKGAVVAMVRAAAGEWASKHIRINCICPGSISTGQGSRSEEQIEQSRQYFANYNPVGRSGEPIDIANAALFLASDASSLITGQKLVVDGGWTSLDARYVEVMGKRFP